MTPKKRKKDRSWLTRFFPANTAKPTRAAKARPPRPAPAEPVAHSPLQQAAIEIKHLMAVGKEDPARLALMVRDLLETERAGKRAAQQRLAEQLRRLGGP